jgi:YD repeat-containing protein
MVPVSAVIYDDGQAGGDSTVTASIQFLGTTPELSWQSLTIDQWSQLTVDEWAVLNVSYSQGDSTRTTTYTYDFRNRRITTTAPEAWFQKMYYDNLNRIYRTEGFDGSESGTMLGREETYFDNRSRVYQTRVYAVDSCAGDVGNALIGNNWYDDASNLIQSIAPGAGIVFAKNEYDSLGRQTLTQVGYEENGSDVIIEQSESTFNEVSSILTQTRKQRDTDDSTFRTTYAAFWYDGINRQIASAEYGTNGGTLFTRPAVTPGRSDDILVTTTQYDESSGDPIINIDPMGIVYQRAYDDAGRIIKQIDNYISPGTPGSDQNRTTEITYTPDGLRSTLTAKMANSADDEVTTYTYGTTLTESSIASNLLLASVEYPDGASDTVTYAYNRQGQVIKRTDQNGTVHTLDYDGLGRLIHDRITTLGSGVDGLIRRISTTYDDRGLITHITSYDDAEPGEGAVVNDIYRKYNDFRQLVVEYQSTDGPVDTATTPKVRYAYALGDNESNQIRPTSITYPDGHLITYSYCPEQGMDDKLNRIAEILDGPCGCDTPLAQYNYLGLNAPVRVSYTEPQVRLDLWGGTSGTYIGLDRFGRIVDLPWQTY